MTDIEKIKYDLYKIGYREWKDDMFIQNINGYSVMFHFKKTVITITIKKSGKREWARRIFTIKAGEGLDSIPVRYKYILEPK